MASFTSFLNLLKKNPATDGKDTFNIETMLNENWDKIDLKVKENSSAIGQNALNLATHKEESASKHIKESGSNANGRYIKFDDGTMICTFEKDVTFTTDIVSGPLYRNSTALTWVFPATFVSPPSSHAIAYSSTLAMGTMTSSTSIQHQYYLLSTTSRTELTYKIGNIAIGRWK